MLPNRISIHWIFIAGWLAASAWGPDSASTETARGIVFEDANRNGVRDAGDSGRAGVGVSNGRDIATTDAEGVYSLDVDDDDVIFVIKPKGWAVPLDSANLPQFYYIHKPGGSPPQRFGGIEPTGPLPASVDFALYRSPEPEKFEAILFGDTQPRNQKEIDYITHDVVEELIGAEGAFGVTLGDVMFNDLSLFGSLNKSIALIGLPWYNVVGNHDINFDAENNMDSDETFTSVYGPAYYSFDYGNTHFLSINNVVWIPGKDGERGEYTGGLGEEQLAFITNDLARIPEDQLLVIFMHIPLGGGWVDSEIQALYRLIEKRPLSFSVSAHTHWQAHTFIGADQGWQGEKPHHHLINVTVCGSWWSGAPDAVGIPHTTMSMGAPNGYTIISFEGGEYSLRYKAARRPDDYQMNIFAPEVIDAANANATEVLVNVFAGSEKSTVEMRVGEDGAWAALEKVDRVDPYYQMLKDREASEPPAAGGYRELPSTRPSRHIWQGYLPSGLAPGTHLIQVRTTDMFGQTYRDERIIRAN